MSMVEWKKIGDIAKRNKGIPITAGQMSELNTSNGNVRVFAAGQTLADINENDLPENCAHIKPSIIVKSRGYIDFVFYEKPFTHKNEMWSYSFDDREEGKFLYYYLTTKTELFRKRAKANSVKLPQLCVSDTDDYLVPYPSHSEQRRIVGILDTFTSSIDNLKQQIAQRRKQYEYYRDQLLDLEGNKIIEKRIFADVCDIYDGTHQTPNYTESGIKFVSVENIRDIYASNKYISQDDYDANFKTKPQKYDVLMTRIGDVGTCAVIDGDEPIAYYVSLSLLRPNQNIITSNFVKYLLESSIGQKELRKRTLLTAVPLKINLGDIGKIVLPIPSLSDQQRIVSILDTFEASIQNLEAQLSQREKQYEYYRNKLLTFE